MKDEIKEMLNHLKDYCEVSIDNKIVLCNRKEMIKLINYITNLQEKLNRIDKLINTDYGWVSYYYKYNNRYLKSEIKEDINNILKGD